MKPENLYEFDPAPLQTAIVVDRNPTTGELIGIREVSKQPSIIF